MTSATARVKGVISGDTVCLVGKSTNGPPPDIVITLSNIITPKISRGPQSVDEPFGYQSKEFLRKLLVGKTVTFRVLQTVTSINRIFGEIFIDGENVIKAVVRAGWANVKEAKDNPELTTELEQLLALAKQEKIGMFTDNAQEKRASIRNINWNLDTVALYQQMCASNPDGRKLINVMVESVKDGATFRCYLPEYQGYATIALAGVLCPRVGNTNPTNTANSNTQASTITNPNLDSPVTAQSSYTPTVTVTHATQSTASASASSPASSVSEPFAQQAKLFSEVRLLCSDVVVELVGISTGGNSMVTDKLLLGMFLHPKGNISVEVIKAGLGKVTDYTIAMLPREVAIALRETEKEAKDKQLGVWAGYTSLPHHPDARQFDARILEIVSSDTFLVAEIQSSKGPSFSTMLHEVKLTLCNIRVPRIGNATKNILSEPYAEEAKEYLRTRLIGKVVTCQIDYSKLGNDGQKRYYGNVFVSTGGGNGGKQNNGSVGNNTGNQINITQQLILNGLGTYMRANVNSNSNSNSNSNKTDDSTLTYYTHNNTAYTDIYLYAEIEAIKNNVNLHKFKTSSNGATANDSVTGGSKAALPLPPAASIIKINDVSSDVKKAKQVFSYIQKNKIYRAVVTYVFTGGRYKITIPSENLAVMFSVSQVRCPSIIKHNNATSSAVNEEKSDSNQADSAISYDALCASYSSVGEEAKAFSYYHIMQRTVDVEILDQDKNGIFLGKLYVVKNNGTSTAGKAIGGGSAVLGLPYTVMLLDQGYASLDRWAEEKGGSDLEVLMKSQLTARNNKLGIWSISDLSPQQTLANYSNVSADNTTDANAELNGGTSKQVPYANIPNALLRVRLSEVYDGVHFAVHVFNNNEDRTCHVPVEVNNMEVEMKALSQELENISSENEVFRPKKGTLACAWCIEDEDEVTTTSAADEGGSSSSNSKVWLRCRVEEYFQSPNSVPSALVLFVDYGHRRGIPVTSLRPLPEHLTAIPPQALECHLAALSSPTPSHEIWRQAARALNTLAWNKDCYVMFLPPSTFNSNRIAYHQRSKPVLLYQEHQILPLVTNIEEGEIPERVPAVEDSINYKLLRNGFVRVSHRIVKLNQGYQKYGGNAGGRDAISGNSGRTIMHGTLNCTELLSQFQEIERNAHNDHLRLWAHGDPGDSDDEGAKDKDKK